MDNKAPKTMAEIVDLLGGTSKVADACDCGPSTVTNWKDTNSVPRWRMKALLALAKKLKVDLTEADFPQRLKRAA